MTTEPRIIPVRFRVRSPEFERRFKADYKGENDWEGIEKEAEKAIIELTTSLIGDRNREGAYTPSEKFIRRASRIPSDVKKIKGVKFYNGDCRSFLLQLELRRDDFLDLTEGASPSSRDYQAKRRAQVYLWKELGSCLPTALILRGGNIAYLI